MSTQLTAVVLAIALTLLALPVRAAETTFTVKPQVGNNTFTAVFDAVIGERITAVSSAVGCTLTVDEEKLEGRASCSVPLTSKKMEPGQCTFEVEVPHVKLPSPVAPKSPIAFTTEGTFTLCGRKREGGPEKITGTVIYLPPGTYGSARTLRIRARIEQFNREQYGVSPRNTPDWLARVQQLAPVVATDGTVDVNIFATSPVAATAASGNP